MSDEQQLEHGQGAELQEPSDHAAELPGFDEASGLPLISESRRAEVSQQIAELEAAGKQREAYALKTQFALEAAAAASPARPVPEPPAPPTREEVAARIAALQGEGKWKEATDLKTAQAWESRSGR